METAIRTTEKIALSISGVSIILIMLIVAVDAMGRYLFSSPLSWSYDFVSYYLMVFATYFALSDTFRNGDHISLSLFRPHMNRKLKAGLDVIWGLLSLAIFTIIAVGAWEATMSAYQNRRYLPGAIPLPVWISYLPIALGSFLLVLRLGHHCFALARRGHNAAVITELENAE